MKVIVDENIPFAAEAFGTLGEVRALAGRALTAAAVREAEALIVRSVTRVGPALLDGSQVRFVGTATIGFDHVDVEYLRRRGIGFASAPGSNANSVAEYVVAALLVMAKRRGWQLAGRTLGVVGVGNVGSRVAAKARALGMNVVENDPPLARKSGDPRFRPIEELFDADTLTLHVPLTREGPDKTHHLVDERFVARMRRRAVLVNTSRGSVAKTSALLGALKTGHLGALVLDVWENEPNISTDLLERVDVGTPHIAGYSFDGKVAGTVMVYEAACRFFGHEACWRADSVMPAPAVPIVQLDAAGRRDEEVVHEAVRAVYDIEADDARLRALLKLAASERGAEFDRLRKGYPVRREFFNTEIRLLNGSERLVRMLQGIGFRAQAVEPTQSQRMR